MKLRGYRNGGSACRGLGRSRKNTKRLKMSDAVGRLDAFEGMKLDSPDKHRSSGEDSKGSGVSEVSDKGAEEPDGRIGKEKE